MILQRIATSAVLITLVIAAVFIDIVFNITAIVLIALGLWEFFSMIEMKGLRIYKYVGTFIGIIIPASIAFRFELTKNWEFLFIVAMVISLIILQFQRKDNSNAIVSVSTTAFGILYVSWFFSFLIKVRYLENGIGLVAMLIAITKSGDIGAYLIGSRFGRTPLIARISPKKTVEGSIGGLVFSILVAVACKALVPSFRVQELLVVGLFLGIVAQLGDLSASLLKRDCNFKDSGKIFPGLGGALDVIDSLLFAAPVFYFYLSR
jgi:phosphatidate cytidylyltransferase